MAASGDSFLYDQCVPFAILKPKNQKNVKPGRKNFFLRNLLPFTAKEKTEKPKNTQSHHAGAA
jgi:hypothetical protein